MLANFLVTVLLALLGQAFGQTLDAKPLKVMLHLDFGSLSHIKALLEMGTVLRKRNHTVIYAAPDAREAYNKPYQFRFISLGKSIEKPGEMRNFLKKMYGTKEKFDSLSVMAEFFGNRFALSYDSLYHFLGQAVDSEKPDVIICDFFSPACRDVAEMKGVPLITGLQTWDGFGIATSPFVTSSISYGSVTTEDMTFWERFNDKILQPLKVIYNFRTMVNIINSARIKHGIPPATMPFGDLSTSLGLSNTFTGFEAAAPLPPHIKLVGPIKSDTYDPLSPELATFLDAHLRTLYIAFGSQVILADFDINNLVVASLTALAEGSIDGVVWGLGQTLLEDFPATLTINGTDIETKHLFENQHPHVRLLAWAPQTAILEHKNTRLFISHGGLESSFEAILSGTPILCMAVLGDQPRNARKLEDAGIGKFVDRFTTTPELLAEDIKYMMVDSTGSIKMNVKRMQTISLVGSRRKEAGADAIEEYAYTAQICRPLYKHQFGQIPCELKHLTMASRNMSYVKTNLLDVYAFAIILTSLPALLVSYLAMTGFGYFGKKTQPDNIKVKKTQ